MIRQLFTALSLTAALTGATLFGASPATAQTPAQQLADMDSMLARLQTELEAATRKISVTQERFKAGLATSGEVDDAQTRAAALTEEFQRVSRERQSAAVRAAFMRPVTIELDHVAVQEVAMALTKATGMSVTVDKGVPANSPTRLTLNAQAVPLANVLEAIADKADLMIAPEGSGVALKPWPHLNDRVFRTASAPWSNDWGVPPTVRAGFGGFGGGSGFFGGQGGTPQPGVGPLPGAPSPQGPGSFGGGPQGGFNPNGPGGPLGGFNPGGPGGPQGGFNPGGPGGPGGPQGGFNPFGGGQPGMAGMPGMQPGLPFTMVGLGDHTVAIAEPGMSDKGEPGIWMTAYLIDGNGFHRMSKGFHPFTNPPRGMPNGAGPDPFRRRPDGTAPPAGRPSGPQPSPGGGAPSPVPPRRQR